MSISGPQSFPTLHPSGSSSGPDCYGPRFKITTPGEYVITIHDDVTGLTGTYPFTVLNETRYRDSA